MSSSTFLECCVGFGCRYRRWPSARDGVAFADTRAAAVEDTIAAAVAGTMAAAVADTIAAAVADTRAVAVAVRPGQIPSPQTRFVEAWPSQT
jgi:hypothetical protein